MPSITVDIDLSDLDDVSRQDVLEFLETHAYKLHDEDIVNMAGDDDEVAEIIALNYIRTQDTDTINNLLEAASYTDRAIDSLTTDDLIENLIRRTVSELNDEDINYLTKALRTKIENVSREYDSYLRELLDMYRSRKRVENMAAAAQSALSH